MFCQLCGTKIEDGEIFCRTCGEMSQSIIFFEDRPNWLKRGGLFFLGVAAFCALLFAFLLIGGFFPIMGRNPELVFGILFFSCVLLSGLISVLLFETKRAHKKLNEEREKRRVAFSNKAAKQIEDTNFEAIPYSVTEHTTKKYIRE